MVLLILGLAVIVGAAACSRAQPSPVTAIVGRWVNDGGGEVQFYRDGSGFIPGNEEITPPIPSVTFTYYFVDDTHLNIKLEGQEPVVIEIVLDAQRMTWRLSGGAAEFAYRKVK